MMWPAKMVAEKAVTAEVVAVQAPMSEVEVVAAMAQVEVEV